jgi:hypothetical protein
MPSVSSNWAGCNLPLSALHRSISLAVMFTMLASPAGAQASRIAPAPVQHDGVATAASGQAVPQGRRDSLWNGTLLGAGLGALSGALGGVAIVECSECAGFNVPLTFGVLGAGVGAGIGAAVDAARHQQSASPGRARPHRVVVAPAIGPRVRAVIAVVRF